MNSQIVSRKNQIRSLIFILLLMTITMIVLLKGYSIHDLIQVIRTSSPIYLITGILLMILYLGSQALNLYIILNGLGHQVTLRRSLQYIFVGYYFGAITPCASGAQPAQLFYMNKDKIRVDLSAIAIFYMVFVSQIVILFLGGILTLAQLPVFLRLQNWLKYLLAAGGIFTFGLILILTALMFSQKIVPYILSLGFKIGTRWRIIKDVEKTKGKMEAMILSYKEKSKLLIKHPDLFFKVFSVTIVQWLFYYLISYMVYRSFGHNDHSGFELVTGQSIISIAVTAVPLPGSVGIAEKAFLMIFQPYYTQQQLPSAMLLSRIINFYLPLFISFVVYLFVHLRVMKKGN